MTEIASSRVGNDIIVEYREQTFLFDNIQVNKYNKNCRNNVLYLV